MRPRIGQLDTLAQDSEATGMKTKACETEIILSGICAIRSPVLTIISLKDHGQALAPTFTKVCVVICFAFSVQVFDSMNCSFLQISQFSA